MDTPPPTRATITFPVLNPDDPTKPADAWTISAPSSPSVTALRFGEFEVISELGEGGMGRVYKAIDRTLGRYVAIKVLRNNDPFEASRFRGEAEMIALLSHPNIVQIYAIDTTPDGRPYIALEFAESGSLDRELKWKTIEPRRAAEIVEVLARAIHYAHEKGVIHRDLKPGNILCCKGDILKITDFGLAKHLEVSTGMTASGAVMGTPSYMSPEQAEGKVKELGPATDIYALGAILYEMLTGRPPFRGTNLQELLEQVRWAEPQSLMELAPRIHRDLATICLKCLRKSPAQRYPTAAALADDLRRWLNGEMIVARSAPSWERAWRQVRRRPWQAATVVATAFACAVLILGGFFYQAQQNQVEIERQQRLFESEQEQNKLADQQRHAELRRENEARLHKRSDEALAALDSIRDLLQNGELRNSQEVNALRSKLFDYYKKLNDQLKVEPNYPKAKLARAWVEIGELIQETGNKDNAMKAYIEARELYLLDRDSPEGRTKLADVEGRLGRVEFGLGHKAEAEQACKTVQSLVGTPANAKQARLLGDVWHLRGELAGQANNTAESRKAFNLAIEFHQEALRYNLGEAKAAEQGSLSAETLAALPGRLVTLEKSNSVRFREVIENLRGLALGYGFLGDVWLNDENLGEADKAYWNAHRVREAVVQIMQQVAAGSPENRDKYRRELSMAQSQFSRGWGNCASIQTRARALGTAKYFSEQALLLRQDISKQNPSVTEFRQDVCNSANTLAELKLRLGEREGVIELLDDACKVPKDRSEQGGYTPQALEILATAHMLRAWYFAYLVEKPDWDRVRTELKESETILKSLTAKPPYSSKVAFTLAAVLAMRVETSIQQNQQPQSGQGVEIWRQERREEAVEKLREANKLGYREKHPDELRELRPFRCLKGTKSFEDLIAELTAARQTPVASASKSAPVAEGSRPKSP
ncbi:MAG: protein kinase [Gemmataceae bacterium]